MPTNGDLNGKMIIVPLVAVVKSSFFNILAKTLSKKANKKLKINM